MSLSYTESDLEHAALEWLAGLGYTLAHGPRIEPGTDDAERFDWDQAVLPHRLRAAIARLNPNLPDAGIDEAFRKLTRIDAPTLIDANQEAHWYLVNGVPTAYLRDDGTPVAEPVSVIDFDHPENNDWLAVNQFTLIEGGRNRRADIVLFVNGLPLAVIELKNPADEKADIWQAFNQLQTYKNDIPGLFTFNECLVVADGPNARIGTLTSSRERFMPWRTVEGDVLAPPARDVLDVLLHGVFEKQRFLDLVRFFTVYERESGKGGEERIIKKQAGYHQFHAVNLALAATLEAARPTGDRRIGVVWHTQGSGKSLTMVFYAGRLVWALENPTIVVLTDRNDLDEQLFGTFTRCHRVLRQSPAQAKDRAHLRKLLQVPSGGVVFTTIQKFFPDEKGDRHPELSARRNIVVIADEAHRTQYGFIDGFARHVRDALPGASFIGFTGTPVEKEDKNTLAVFGDYIDIYDIRQSVDDHATVPIYYEGRWSKLELPEELKPRVDAEFEEVTESEEEDTRKKVGSRWTTLEAVIGTQQRIDLIAKDFVAHLENRWEALDGKAMFVCASRRICVAMYDAIVKLRPGWHGDGDDKGRLKVIMTGNASDLAGLQPHIRPKAAREEMANRFRDPADPFDIVIVRDMWLTGFDAPSLHTMYVDKPMHGHSLMQAIARVNRVFRDKPGGLVVDYLGIADSLKDALTVFAKGKEHEERSAIDQEEAVRALLEKLSVCRAMYLGFDRGKWTEGSVGERTRLLAAAREHALAQEDGKNRLVSAVREVSQAFALSVPNPKAIAVRDEVGFFQAVRAGLLKLTGEGSKSPDDLDHAVRQIVSRAVTSDEVVDIFTAAGLDKPRIDTLSEEFMAEVRGMKHRNLAVELLKRLLSDKIKDKGKTNLVKFRAFSEMLEAAIKKYTARAVTTAQIIEELIELAGKLREDAARGKATNLDEAEIAFYDALETNNSAVKVLGDDTLREIAHQLVVSVKANATIDWTMKESVRAKLRLSVKRILKKYGYPPDLQEQATKTVLEQAALLGSTWAG